MTKDEGSDSMRMWGLLLRLFRIAAGVTYEELATYIGYSKSLIVGVERGTRKPSPSFITKADACVKANGWLIQAAQHLSRQQLTSWSGEYEVEEQRARALWTYDTHTVHDLLRTETYARTLHTAHRPIMTEEEIDTRIQAMQQRQTLLTQPQCTLSFIIEETALRRPTGGPHVMKAQLDHLTALTQTRNITIQIMPTTPNPHPGLNGPITLLQTPDHTWYAHLQIQDTSNLIHNPDQISTLHDRYTHLRSHALTPADSAALIQQLTQEQQTPTA